MKWFNRKIPSIPSHLRVCKGCDGGGISLGGFNIGKLCDHCGGAGLRERCSERDCMEFGCSFGTCAVAYKDAEKLGYPTRASAKAQIKGA